MFQKGFFSETIFDFCPSDPRRQESKCSPQKSAAASQCSAEILCGQSPHPGFCIYPGSERFLGVLEDVELDFEWGSMPSQTELEL